MIFVIKSLKMGDVGEIQVDTKLAPDAVFFAIGVAIASAIVSETINWFLIYRQEEYKKAVQDALKSQEQVDSLREKLVFSAGTLSAN